MGVDLLDILTPGEAKQAINAETMGDSPELQLYVTGISRRIDELAGPVVNRTLTEYYDGGGWSIELRSAPVSSVTSVTEYDSAGAATVLTAADHDTFPANGYQLDTRARRRAYIHRRLGSGAALFPCGSQNVAVVYVAGRAATTATVDAKFKLCCGSILRRVWQREAPSWQRTDDFGDAVAADGIGFFRAVDPMVREFLGRDLGVPVA